MALKPCRECKTMVGTSAKSCPHCGTPNPTSETLSGWKLALLILTVIVGGIFIVSKDDKLTNAQQQATAIATASEADRKKLEEDQAAAVKMGVSLETFRWGKESSIVARILCKDNVIDNSRYGGRSDWIANYSWSINVQRA